MENVWPNIFFFKEESPHAFIKKMTVFVGLTVFVICGAFIADGIVLKVIIQNDVARKDSLFGLLFTAIASVVVFNYNIRIKSRTENRMRWIGELRSEISRILGSMGAKNNNNKIKINTIAQGNSEYFVSRQYRFRNAKKIKPCAIEVTETVSSRFELMARLELLLNSSEKDHRALVALMRLCLDTYWLSVDRAVLWELGFRIKEYGNGKVERKFYDDKCKYPRRIDDNELISMVFRLSQFVLKREWEQVKSVK